MPTLRETTSEAHTFILWLEYNYEGEALSLEVINICKTINPEIIIYLALFNEINTEL